MLCIKMSFMKLNNQSERGNVMLTNKYRILIQLYESRSIKKAAEALSYSQSAVSQALQSIENEMGVRLFIRRKSGLHITNEGSRLYPVIRKIYDAENDLQQDIASLKGLVTGEIKIGVYHTVACRLLPDVIKEFRESYPSISFKIKEGDNTEIRNWLADDQINFGILSLNENEDNIAIRLIDDPFYVIMSKDDEFSGKDTFSINEIPDRDYIHLSEFRDKNDIDAFEKSGVRPKGFCSVDQYETIEAMVERGLGISILPELAIGDSYNLSKALLDPPYYRHIGVLITDRQLNSISVKTFLSFITRKFQAPEDEDREDFTVEVE